ncbi:N-acetylglucosamine-specific PTS transporter subunit IIBC [Clostridium sp. CM028]|uniref:N-acetylglucosamine-specific PTS transporter subunit IIBC n=1 Tax=Clostridium sp. CM028 TaxID=2851575 RepID=UPI001C6E12EB|nr:N-acetylglucosamine-specific PTS transporter subunit IIBC [Clostridium sp. CM028]MBW9147950.1 N-acetylglucosamine-specific PTS transporter subunit IIBC [Clostridium sp. CM028]WLC61381.1 N-acetylglucosamine-specific PTS transporter subunit IIBC [Clostridium sp. CM028]
MSKNNKFSSNLQKLGKAMMMPIAVMPAAGLLLRLGAPDIFNIAWMFAAGNAIFGHLPIIFAIGIAIGLADDNNGVAGLAAAVGYFVLTEVAVTFNSKIDMGVLAGIIVGILSGYLYNKYKSIRVPDFLGFFGGKRFVPIITSFYTLIIGVGAGYIWPHIQDIINNAGNVIAHSGSIGAFFYGVLNRLLIPFGLHHVMNTLVWVQFGTFTDAAGKVITGDMTRFFALDPTAGTFMTGFFPIMMFGLPAACLAMIATAKKENRKAVTGMLLGIAFTAFLTGITEPIEFLFMFIAPALYLIHALLTGAAFALTSALGIKSGFTFSAGILDYVLSFGIASKPILLIIIGLIFGVIYFFVFFFSIKKFDLKTPGRGDDETSPALAKLNTSELGLRAISILEAIGGKANIETIDACITRVRLTIKNNALINETRLKDLGATAVMKIGNNNYQIIVGTIADPLVTQMKIAMTR